MKRIIILIWLFIFSFYGFSQSLMNDSYELYLIKYEENTLNIDRGMNMTNKNQTYYNGTIEAVSTNSGKLTNHSFFFSIWDDKFKEFLIKDEDHQTMEPQLSYQDNENILFIKKGKKSIVLLKDISTIEKAILSSMFIWLDNQNIE